MLTKRSFASKKTADITKLSGSVQLTKNNPLVGSSFCFELLGVGASTAIFSVSHHH